MRAVKERDKSMKIPKRKVYSNATNTSTRDNDNVNANAKEQINPKSLCPIWGKDHLLMNCKRFDNMKLSERIDFTRKERLCDNCFKVGHIAKRCFKRSACTIMGCAMKHHTLLHRYPGEKCSVEKSVVPSELANSGMTVTRTSAKSVDCKDVYLNIIPVRVTAPNGKNAEIYCFIDSGSTSCLCDERLMDMLELTGKRTKFSITTVSNTNPKPQNGFAIDITVASLTGEGSAKLPPVLTVDALPVSVNKLPADFDAERYSYLKGIEFPRLDDHEALLMVGLNFPAAFHVMEERRGGLWTPLQGKVFGGGLLWDLHFKLLRT